MVRVPTVKTLGLVSQLASWVHRQVRQRPLSQQHLRNTLVFCNMPALNQPEAFIQWRDGMIDAQGSFNERTKAALCKLGGCIRGLGEKNRSLSLPCKLTRFWARFYVSKYVDENSGSVKLVGHVQCVDDICLVLAH